MFSKYFSSFLYRTQVNKSVFISLFYPDKNVFFKMTGTLSIVCYWANVPGNKGIQTKYRTQPKNKEKNINRLYIGYFCHF